MAFLIFLLCATGATLIGIWRHKCIYMQARIPINCPLGWRNGVTRFLSWLIVVVLTLGMLLASENWVSGIPDAIGVIVVLFLLFARWGVSWFIGSRLAARDVARMIGDSRDELRSIVRERRMTSGDDPSLTSEGTALSPKKRTVSKPSAGYETSTVMDQFIRAVYGDPPPKKTARLTEAIQLTYEDLLMKQVRKEEIAKVASDLYDGPIPYSTHDLALSVALNFFKRPDLVPVLFEAQLVARLTATLWLMEKKAVAPLVEAFEKKLYELYKPDIEAKGKVSRGLEEVDGEDNNDER